MLASRRVDAHAHLLPGPLEQALARRDEAPRLVSHDGSRAVDCGDGLVYPLIRSMTDLELRAEQMEEAGVTQSVLTVVVPGVDRLGAGDGPVVARECNDLLADTAAASGGRFAALATLPMQRPTEAAEELRRAVGRGLRGALLYSNVGGRYLDAPEFRLVFAAAAELDVPLALHPTNPVAAATVSDFAFMTTLGFLQETSVCALRLVLDGLYVRHPGFKLLVPHVGAILPYILGRIDYESERYAGAAGVLDVPPSEHVRRFYLDSVSVWLPALRLALDVFGPERVLLGTDQPFWDMRKSLDVVDAAGLDEEDAARVCHGNADRLFGLDG
jgi:predicted TIM-barrel fold metal-dependent hydrolase